MDAWFSDANGRALAKEQANNRRTNITVTKPAVGGSVITEILA